MDIVSSSELMHRNRKIYERIVEGADRRYLAAEFDMTVDQIDRIYRNQKNRALRKTHNITAYIDNKLIILAQLGIRVSNQDKEYMRSMTREVDIDNFAHRLIVNSN